MTSSSFVDSLGDIGLSGGLVCLVVITETSCLGNSATSVVLVSFVEAAILIEAKVVGDDSATPFEICSFEEPLVISSGGVIVVNELITFPGDPACVLFNSFVDKLKS